MTVVGFTTIHPNPGVRWEDVQKQIKKACDLARKHGAENVTVLVTMVGGPATNTIGVLSTTEDWATYGTVQKPLLDDPKMLAVLQEAGQIATWETYVSQTIPDM
jgi:sugar phosphate isomerase/epimerase